MVQTTKKWLWVGILLVAVGLVLGVAVLWTQGFDMMKLNTAEFVTNTYEIREQWRGISIATDTADVAFVLSQDGKCKVECYEEVRAIHSVSIKDNTLSIELQDQRTWYDYVGILFTSPKITVYLPQGEFGELQVNEDTGNVCVPKGVTFSNIDISTGTGDVEVLASAKSVIKLKTNTGAIILKDSSAETLSLSTSTGRICVEDVACSGEIKTWVSTGETSLTNVTCKYLSSEGSTGDIEFDQVIVDGVLSVSRSTGDVRFAASDALSMVVETDTGSITGSLLTGKSFVAKSDTGKVKIPKATDGGRCYIETDTGNITITVTQP